MTVLDRPETGRRGEDGGGRMVLPSGIEPASPALQAGAITRSAFRAKSWPETEDGHCPATGIVDYLVVKDHPRPSPRLLPRFIKVSESGNVDSRFPFTADGARLPGRADARAEMKKAAEVDFTWAAWAGTYERRVLANRPPGDG